MFGRAAGDWLGLSNIDTSLGTFAATKRSMSSQFIAEWGSWKWRSNIRKLKLFVLSWMSYLRIFSTPDDSRNAKNLIIWRDLSTLIALAFNCGSLFWSVSEFEQYYHNKRGSLVKQNETMLRLQWSGPSSIHLRSKHWRECSDYPTILRFACSIHDFVRLCKLD